MIKGIAIIKSTTNKISGNSLVTKKNTPAYTTKVTNMIKATKSLGNMLTKILISIKGDS